MMTKLTTAQKRAWELIKSEIALLNEGRKNQGVIGGIWGKTDEYSLTDRKAITRKTMSALHHAGLIDPTDTWMSRFYFKLTDAGKAEMAESAEPIDAAPYPAAHGRYVPSVTDLDALYTPEQRAFNASIAHKGLAQITDADREAAAKVGLTLADFRMTTGCKGWDAPLRLVLPGMMVQNGR